MTEVSVIRSLLNNCLEGIDEANTRAAAAAKDLDALDPSDQAALAAAGRAKEAIASVQTHAASAGEAVSGGLTAVKTPGAEARIAAINALADAAGHVARALQAADDAAAETGLAAEFEVPGVKGFLRDLGLAIGLMRRDQKAQSSIDTTAKIAQAGALAVVQDHLDSQEKARGKSASARVDWGLRIVAVLAGLVLIGAAAGLYASVKDTAPVTATTTTTVTTTTATTTTTTTATGTTAPSGTTGADIGTTTDPATGATSEGNAATQAASSSHPSTAPIAFVIAGAILIGLGLFAPRANSITASKDSVALTLSPEEDPLTRLTKSLTAVFGATAGGGGGPGGPSAGTTEDTGHPGTGTSGQPAGKGAQLALLVGAQRIEPTFTSPAGEQVARYVVSPEEFSREGGQFEVRFVEPPPASPGRATTLHPDLAEKVVDALTQTAIASSTPQPRRRLWPWAG